MKRIALLVALATVALAGSSFGQADTLLWGNTVTSEQPLNNGWYLPTGGTSATGALVQVINKGASTVTNAPNWAGNGLTGDDVLAAWSWYGKGGTSLGLHSDYDTFANLNIGLASNIMVRVWDRPTSGAGALPTPIFYAGYGTGAFYWDCQIEGANANPIGGGFYNYTIPTITEQVGSSWTFMPVPEPGTILLMLSGVVALAWHKRKR